MQGIAQGLQAPRGIRQRQSEHQLTIDMQGHACGAVRLDEEHHLGIRGRGQSAN